jgi:3',5'-cyclic AMP phosphodiesterase CpdA
MTNRRRVALAAFVLLALWLAPAAARQASGAAPFFFLQISDPQFGMFTGDKDFAQETANFEFVVTTANRLRPAFVIDTGDLVNKAGDAAQIAEYRRIAARLDPAIPLYNVAGNHDVGNAPTPEGVAAYTKIFGPDRYTFRSNNLVGIVLDSSLIHTPTGAPALAAAQEQWLRTTLDEVRREGPGHIVIFQHHPWFLKDAAEPDQYYNIPGARRAEYLTLFHAAGVKYVFSGHYHQSALARDGDIEAITTGPVGKPNGGTKSGVRVVIVRERTIEHRFYELGEMPNRIDVGGAAR